MESRSEWIFLPESIDPYGVTAVGGELSVARLKRAYQRGIFPWPQDGHLLWFSPQSRGVLDFAELHVGRRLARSYKNSGLRFTRDQAFSEVIRGCQAAPRRNQSGTWITNDLVRAYEDLHREGWAHSVEAWRENSLIGGLYGVLVPKILEQGYLFFSGESVFAKESDVTKFCLLHTIEWLKSVGLNWMDLQMVTPLTQPFGAKLESRERFMKRIIPEGN